MTSDNRGQRILRPENWMDRRKFMKLVGVGSGISLAGCFGKPPSENASDGATSGGKGNGDGSSNKDTLTTVIGGTIGGSLYPSTNVIIETVTATNMLYNSIMSRDPATGKVVPDAVKSSPKVSNNGTKFTFDLREDITFHDGSKMTAQDVKYSFDVLHKYDLVHGETFNFENIEIEDDYRITFYTKQPYAPWVAYTILYFGIVREGIAEEVDKFPDDLENGPKKGCNSGPFKLVEYKPQSIARFKAYEDYHEKNVPRVNEVRMKVIKEPSTRRIALKNGDVDIIGDPIPKAYKPLAKAPNIKGGAKPNPLSRITIYLSHKPPFDNKHLRKALAYAIDRKAIIETVLYGQGFSSSVPAPPGTWFYNEKADYYGDRPKPKKVKEHLEKAGKPNGFSFDLMTSAQPPTPNTATLIQQNLSQFGIDMNIKQVSPGSFYGEIAALNYTAGLEFWNSVPYPGYYISTLFTDFGKYKGWHKWGDYGETKQPRDHVTKLMSNSRKYAKREKRAPYLKESQRVLADEVPFVWAGGMNVSQVWREDVQNYHILPTVWQNLRHVGKK